MWTKPELNNSTTLFSDSKLFRIRNVDDQKGFYKLRIYTTEIWKAVLEKEVSPEISTFYKVNHLPPHITSLGHYVPVVLYGQKCASFSNRKRDVTIQKYWVVKVSLVGLL